MTAEQLFKAALTKNYILQLYLNTISLFLTDNYITILSMMQQFLEGQESMQEDKKNVE